MKKKVKIRTQYLNVIYGSNYVKLINKTIKKITLIKKKNNFDAIAFSGSSGAAIAYPISYLLKLPLIHVRKDKSHYGNSKVEGCINSNKYIIIDDFISSGATIKRIIKTIDFELNGITEPIAICLYNSIPMINFHYKNKIIPIFTVT